MPASTKDELLATSNKEFEKLNRILETVDPEFALSKDQDDISIKDVVAHRAHWIQLFLGWYEDGLAGREVFFPARGYKWNELKQYNAVLRSLQTSMSWPESVSALGQGYEQLTSFISGASDSDLYSRPMAGAHNHWSPGRWAEAAGPSHFRSATKYVRARLRNV